MIAGDASRDGLLVLGERLRRASFVERVSSTWRTHPRARARGVRRWLMLATAITEWCKEGAGELAAWRLDRPGVLP